MNRTANKANRTSGLCRRRLAPPIARRGVALIVVIGVLAALLALAITFALVTRLELRASRNVTLADDARAAAWGYLDSAMRTIRDAGFSEYDKNATGVNVNDWVPAADTDAVQITDEDSRFNINAMGFPGDQGIANDERQRFTSFEASLVRLLDDRLAISSLTSKYPDLADTSKRQWLARAIATGCWGTSDNADPALQAKWVPGILEWRYGSNPAQMVTRNGGAHPVPGNAGYDLSHDGGSTHYKLEQYWGWQIYKSASWTDNGLGMGRGAFQDSNDRDELGWHDGYPSLYGTLSGGALVYSAETDVWRGRDPSNPSNFHEDVGTGYPLAAGSNSYDNIGRQDGIPNFIRAEDGAAKPEAGAGSTSLAEVADPLNALFEFDPQSPVGDDRPYTSVTQILPVIQRILRADGLAEADAWAEAQDIYNAVKDYLTVYSHAQTTARPGGGGGVVSINSWYDDRIDNDHNGTVDDAAENVDTDAYVTALRDGLGLTDLVNAGTVTQEEADQLVANIIDFRDTDNTPTKITDAATGRITYGAEALHITELMGTPAALTSSDGSEMKDDGGSTPGTDTADEGWDWDGVLGCWKLGETANPGHRITGRFEFSGTFRKGWYAVRIKGGGAGDRNLQVCTDGASWQEIPSTATDNWTYLRDSGKLDVFQVTDETTFTIYVRCAKGGPGVGNEVRFYGLQFLPQFVEITNIGTQGPRVTGSRDISLAGCKLIFPDRDGTAQTLTLFQNGGTAKYYDPVSATAKTITGVPAVRADGKFPINYGNLVIAVSELAYERNFGQTSYSETWGDSPEEPTAVYFIGDATGVDATDNAGVESFLLGCTNVTVSLLSATDAPLAGGLIDFDHTDGPPPATAVAITLPEYQSMEKTTILNQSSTPHAVWTACNWDTGTTDNLVYYVSQNVPTKANDDTYNFRSCLNKNYDIWDATSGFPTLKAPATMRTDKRVFPLILNRAYASPGWLGLVPAGRAWRTIDPNPNPAGAPAGPQELLGVLMSHAVVGGVYARVNLNTASEPVLKAIFSAAAAAAIRNSPNRPWTSWDALLNDDLFRKYNSSPMQIGFGDDGYEGSGAGSYADDFVDDSDEYEEFFRRYGNLITIRSSAFRINVNASVVRGDHTGVARLEAVFDRDYDADHDGVADEKLRMFRYATEPSSP